MQAEYYSDKSIAVFGETKPWASNLRTLGGKFNGSLRGRPGWIFQRAKEPELMQFIAQANQGMIQPAPVTTFTAAPTQMVPQGYMQPAMSPQAALTQLTTAQATTPFRVPSPRLAMPQQNILAPKPLSPAPVGLLPQQPLGVSFPNTFTAADGLSYQIILYTAPIPTVGQFLTVSVGEDSFNYQVSAINSESYPIDDILITQVLPGTAEPDTEPATSRAIIMKGKWQIFCMQNDHTITLHPMTQ
jgi:hypothetical protein